MSDRRKRTPQDQLPGGRRQDDPPLTTRECADWMGVEPDYIRDAINQGVWSTKDKGLALLKAAYIPGPSATSRGEYRIYIDDFILFLTAISWPRIPARR